MLAFFIFRGKLDSLLTNVTDSLTELIDLYTGEGVARQMYEAKFPVTQPMETQQQVPQQQAPQQQVPPQSVQSQQNPEQQ